MWVFLLRFYAMTNSVPFESARWLTGAEMRRWVGRDGAPSAAPMGAPLAAQAKLADARASISMGKAGMSAPAAKPAASFAPATAFYTPVPIPTIEAAPAPAPKAEPRLAYLDLGLTLF